MEITLWDHQKLCIEKARERDYHALFMDAGVGKSATCVNILREKYNKNKKVLPTLIIAPPVVILNWKNEFLKYSKIKPEKIVPLVGTGKERAELLKSSSPDSIFISNYESLNMVEVLELYKKILKSEKSCLVLDECHRVKDISAKRTKRAIELADLATYRYILSGTPILNDLMDIYTQFRVLDRGERFGHNFFSFRARFFEDKNRSMPSSKYFPRWEPIKGADRKIKELIDPVTSFAKKEDCLTLPPLVKKVIEVPLSKEQQRLYDSMKKDLVAIIQTNEGDKHSIAELAITKALRLVQIVSGHLRIENDGGEVSTVKIKDNPRKEALKEILEDLVRSGKVIVWSVFIDNYEDIRDVCDKLKIKYVELHGGTKDKESEAQKFREDEEIKVLIGNPFSAGLGINLVEAKYSVYYSRNFSLEADLQSEARNFRGGSHIHDKITRIDLVSPGTIDELILKSLEQKQQLSDSILRQRIHEI